MNYFKLPLHIVVVEVSQELELTNISDTVQTSRLRLSMAIQKLVEGFGFQYHRVRVDLMIYSLLSPNITI